MDKMSIKIGDVVKMVGYDAHGYLGRSLHPVANDRGFTGIVVDILVDCEGDVVFLVDDVTRQLELMPHEVERVDRPQRHPWA